MAGRAADTATIERAGCDESLAVYRPSWTACARVVATANRLPRAQPPRLDANRHLRQIRAEQIRLLFEQLPSALIATTIVGGLVVYVLWGHVSRLWLAVWLLGSAVTTLARVGLQACVLQGEPADLGSRTLGTPLPVRGADLGRGVGRRRCVSDLRERRAEQMFLPFVLAGLAAGGMSTLSSFRGTYAAFLLPAIVPFAVKMMLRDGEMFVAMSSMLILFIAMMSLISARHYRSVTESLLLRFDNAELVDDLAAARDRQESINLELQGQMQERRRTEDALRRATRSPDAGRNDRYRIPHLRRRRTHPGRQSGVRRPDRSPHAGRDSGTLRCRVDRTLRCRAQCARDQGVPGQGYVRNLEIDYVDARGRITPIEINASVVETDGQTRVLYLSRDITERRKSDRDLRRSHDELERKVQERTAQLAQANDVLRTEKDLFRVTLASIGDAVITTDATARITYLNTVAERLTGWEDSTARGRPLIEIFRIVDEVTREPVEDPVGRRLQGDESVGPGNRSLLICRDQRELNIDMSVASIRDSDNASIGVVLVFRDVTEERRLAQQLSHQATHDTLTGLVNRPEFERRLTHLLDSANPHAPHALLYLDLDQFKVVNDTCGHAAGDDLLRQISALLRTKLRARDTLARLGGDEFGVLLEHCSVVEAERIANSLRELLQSFRFGWGDKSFTIGASIGLVPIAQAGETLAGVFSAADSSCYAAKEKGRNRVHVYQPGDAMLAQRDGEMRWMPRIQQALADERFRLYYQPILPVGPNTLERDARRDPASDAG